MVPDSVKDTPAAASLRTKSGQLVPQLFLGLAFHFEQADQASIGEECCRRNVRSRNRRYAGCIHSHPNGDPLESRMGSAIRLERAVAVQGASQYEAVPARRHLPAVASGASAPISS